MITLNIKANDFNRIASRAKVFHHHVSRTGQRAYRVRSGHSVADYSVRFFLIDGEKKAAAPYCGFHLNH